jgi:HAD superfamily hydrolase (TIGR01459 family)
LKVLFRSMTAIPLITDIATLAQPFDVWFLDIWGVLHNGVRPYPGAVSATQKFRAHGGRVVLVSNSPRPRSGVGRQLDQIGVPQDAYDAILTSGDVSRTLIAARAGQTVFHLGPERDLPVYEGLDATLGKLDDARAIVCTGLFDDEKETPSDYLNLLRSAHARDLEMICVNPDIKVERGSRIIYCAGALAQAYEDMGGRVLYAGKPHRPIYVEALRVARGLRGGDLDEARVLAIGDGAKTDIGGARNAGLAAVYIASAVSMLEGETLSDAAGRLFPDPDKRPLAVMSALA